MKPQVRMHLFIIIAALVSCGIDMASATRRPFNHQSPFREECVSGDGSSYRGTVSQSKSGRQCLNWNILGNKWEASSGLGNHNFCRNPNHSVKPWCRVRKENILVREFCNIPKCSPPDIKSPVVQDTELTCGQRTERRTYRVVGGSFTSIEAQPWTAAIFTRHGQFLCGGSLITPCWVLTAAHCFEGLEAGVNKYTVILGKRATNETNVSKEQKFMVEKLVTHKRYNSSNYDNDIALIKIKNKDGGCAAKSATTRTVCLPPRQTQLPVGFQCSVVGYGKESYDAWGFSKVLKEGHVSLLSQSQCRRKDYYGNGITGNMFCAASPNWNTDACRGDSGGPLVCEVSGRMFQFGVVSWGEHCAKKNKPGVYTKVTNYNKWIAKHTGLPKYTAGIMYPTK